ncbi:nuclear pore complex protein nup93 [Culex quinquefasciatus]|uniref:Nuclear pore complex protein nup93 n=1 Tax=Culex quinquefasciatus TaxID=7176 RepID=B0WGS1_CULQU|nr:nuclear pore complex protein nup93 [Culex quinquefasciatus]|eukprot:XP_001847905.1 nuclear pore complex protein nup93 [Culex quinquefasciatus]
MSSMACRGSSEVAAVAASNPEAAPARRLARRPGQCRISLKLKTLSSRTFEPFDPMSDIQSILRNEKKNAILSVIQEVHKNSFQATQNAKILNLIGSFVGLKFANQNQNSSFIGLQDGHLEASLANGLLLSARWRHRICPQGHANGRTRFV